MIEVKGRGGISAKIIAHSKSAVNSKEILTVEGEVPRFILAEINKHRALSNNCQSSRAVPVKVARKAVLDDPVVPIEWLANKAGMQADKPLGCFAKWVCRTTWIGASKIACGATWILEKAGLHKQWTTRLLEPWMRVRIVITGTEWDNFFYLRCHKDSQPEFQEFAKLVLQAKKISKPKTLLPGQWHLPYVDTLDCEGVLGDSYFIKFGYNMVFLNLEDAIKTSAASVAQVSFRKLDQTIVKVENIYSKLVDGEQPHSVCLEHQATPMENEFGELYGKNGVNFEKGVTHHTTDGSAWSGNLKSWVQYRQTLPNHTCWNYKEE